MTSCREQDELLSALWPLLEKNIRNRTFRKCDPLGVLEAVAVEWIHGKAFHNLLEILTDANVRIIAGKQLRQFKLDHVVDICESAFAYDGTLVVGAVTELIELVHPEGTDSLISELQELQKRLKYGVPSSSAIVLYELGFADRAVSMDLASIINVTQSNKNTVRKQIKEERHRVAQLLSKYPAYFTKRLKDVL